MDDFHKPLRRYYEDQRLSTDRAAAILAAGQAIVVRRKRRTFWLRGLAAAVVVGAGILAGFSLRETNSLPTIQRLATSDIASAVVRFFAQPVHALGRLSNDGMSLKQWLASQGSPSSFEFPTVIAQLESFGCQVLEVRGQRVSLLCFFLDEAPGGTPQPTANNAPNGGTSAEPAKTKPRPLVHLLAAPRSAFRDSPQPGERVRLDPVGNWKFVSWVKDDLVFVAASDAPVELLTDVFGAL